MRNSLTYLILPILTCLISHGQQGEEVIETKGAIIIASLEGEVVVTNNQTGLSLPSQQVKAGGIITDGHTVKTGPTAKIVLLFSSGTITTLKLSLIHI